MNSPIKEHYEIPGQHVFHVGEDSFRFGCIGIYNTNPTDKCFYKIEAYIPHIRIVKEDEINEREVGEEQQ